MEPCTAGDQNGREPPEPSVVGLGRDSRGAWLRVNALVRLLREEGYPNAKRSQVVRMSLLELRDALAGRTRTGIVKYFVQRDAARQVATVNGTIPRLPSS